MEALFAEARAAASAVQLEAARGASVEAVQLAARLKAAQDKLQAKIEASLPGAVREAASKGDTRAVVLQFSGADLFEEEFCYLFLLRGGRRHEDTRLLRAAGFGPLLYRLRTAFAPFRVHHLWISSTNQNELSVSW